MEKVKKVYNTYLLYRWNGALIFTLLFILIGIAPLIISCFFKVFTLSDGGTPLYDINSLDMVMNLFGQPKESIVAINSMIETLKTANSVLGLTFSIIFNYVLPIFFLLGAVFVFVLVIFFLTGLLSGRFFHWKGPFIMMIWVSILSLLYFGGIIALSVVFNLMVFPQVPEWSAYSFGFLFAIIYLGATVFVTVILGLIYLFGFKGREFIPNQEYLDNYIQSVNHGISRQNGYQPQPIIINNAPAPVAQPQPASVKEQKNVTPTPVAQPAKTKVVTKVRRVKEVEVDQTLKNIGGHAYAKNIYLKTAQIPDGVTKIGPSAFANCVNVKVIIIPASVKEIGYNAFFNCKSCTKVVYSGKKEQWRKIQRGSNWLAKAGTTIVSCIDGAIQVNPYRK